MSRWQKVYQNPETARQGDDLLDSLLEAPSGPLEEAKRRLFAKLRFEVPDTRVIRAMEQVPREAFVPPELHPYSYQDRALPIGEEQTISQPLIVAIMTSALELRGDEKVLEIGTGSGYQAAVLAQLAATVVSTERKTALLEAARQRLFSMGIRNVEALPATSGVGCPDQAPYQAILVTAGAPRIPERLVMQLDERGRLVIPLGPRQQQELLKYTKVGGKIEVQRLGPCGFVPLVGDEAWPEEKPSRRAEE